VALRHARSESLQVAKSRYLNASTADGTGGRHSTGVRWWVQYHVWGLGESPIPTRNTDTEYLLFWEDRLEDFALWMLEYRPSGRPVSAKTVGKYCSSVRAWLRRHYRVKLKALALRAVASPTS
jgi:hypothetical protein